jgi:hypothetical protein
MNDSSPDSRVEFELTHQVEPGPHGVFRQNEPVRIGVPLPIGACAESGSVSLFDADGNQLPIQVAVLDKWRDGSIRWILLDFQASARQRASTFTVAVSNGRPQPSPAERVKVSEEEGTLVVDTGPVRFRLGTGSSGWFSGVDKNGTPLIDGARSGIQVADEGGAPLLVEVRSISREEAGPLRAVLSAAGVVLAQSGREALRIRLRLHFFAGLAAVRHELTILNPRRAVHAGGFWELGDPGSVHFREVSVALSLPTATSATEIICWPSLNEAPASSPSYVHVYQDSSGGENWRSSNHIAANGELSVQFRGYRLQTNAEDRAGFRATPSLALRTPDGTIAVATQHFWENFPKSMTGERTGIRIGLFPRETRLLHELQGGEQKTHTFTFLFGDDTVTHIPLDWCRRPSHTAASPQWYCATEAVKYLVPIDDESSIYRGLTATGVEGAHSFENKREIVDEYGWRHFGDLYADHENARNPSSNTPLVSHYNNQYDALAGCAYQFLMSGDPRWWNVMDQLARHAVDIDLYHTDQDKAAYNHGFFWHTDHYQDAGKSTHRTFPRREGIRGGGPSADHNYTTGLMLHYFLTGDRRSMEAVVELGRWLIRLDDGRLTKFRWLDRGPTGFISVSGTITEHGPSRGSGNSLNALLDAYRLSQDSAFIEKAEELIRRCVHPEDDVASRDLLDAERRWYYIVFLQALGKYLDWKVEAGQLNEMYGYARASLLTYARWMRTHERPFLDHPERLEYPTETWAAQDIRKSDIFSLAATHAAGDEREQFNERGQFFYDYALTTLQQMPTHTFTRPTVLLLGNGLVHRYFMHHPVADAPSPRAIVTFGLPERFVPQKVRAKKRIIAIAIGVACAAAAGVAKSIGLW